jgi:hypothetical protein
MVHGVKIMLDLHLEWVVVLQVDVQNIFNLVSWTTIFQELWSSICTLDRFFPFVCWFYTHSSPLYFLEASKYGDLNVISSEFGTQ